MEIQVIRGRLKDIAELEVLGGARPGRIPRRRRQIVRRPLERDVRLLFLRGMLPAFRAMSFRALVEPENRAGREGRSAPQ